MDHLIVYPIMSIDVVLLSWGFW